MRKVDPHRGMPVLTSGPSPANARVTMILVHGRGADADDILGLAAELNANDIACLAPQAANGTWYPYSFTAPLDQNEPFLGSALGVLSQLVDRVLADGVAAERVALLGFSQGACLTLEYAARHARRYAGIFGLSGALIGPAGTPRNYDGTFAATPVLIGCSDVDPHIPLDRVRESADVFRRMGASVDERIYPRMGHSVNRDELEAVERVLHAVSR